MSEGCGRSGPSSPLLYGIQSDGVFLWLERHRRVVVRRRVFFKTRRWPSWPGVRRLSTRHYSQETIHPPGDYPIRARLYRGR